MGIPESLAGLQPTPTETSETLPLSIRKFVVVRHGNYDLMTGTLSPLGRMRVASLGERISNKIKDQRLPALILSSPAPRALETAKIIAKALEKVTAASVEEHKSLYSNSHIQGNPDFQAVLNEIKLRRAGINVVVAHAPYCLLLSEFFLGILGMKLNLDLAMPFREGEGLMIGREPDEVVRLYGEDS